MRRRDIIRSIGTAGVGSVSLASINISSAERAEQNLINRLLDTTTVQRLREEFRRIDFRTEQAERVDITLDRSGEEPSGYRVVHIPSHIGEVSIMLMGEYVVSLMMDVNENGKDQMRRSFGPEPLPDTSVDEVTVMVSDGQVEVMRSVTEKEREEIATALSKDSEDLFMYRSSLENGYTAVDRDAADKTKSELTPASLSTGEQINVYRVSKDRETVVENRTETFGQSSNRSVQPAGVGRDVAYCVTNSTSCILTIDTCLKCKIPCMASKIPGNPSFAGVVAVCLICISHTCGHELTAVLADEGGSCEAMLCCLSDFSQYISGDRIDPDGLIDKIPAYSCN